MAFPQVVMAILALIVCLVFFNAFSPISKRSKHWLNIISACGMAYWLIETVFVIGDVNSARIQ